MTRDIPEALVHPQNEVFARNPTGEWMTQSNEIKVYINKII